VLNAKDPLALASQDYTTLEWGNPSLNAKQNLLIQTGEAANSVSGPVEFEGGFAVVLITETLPAGPKSLSECRGQVITDLQKALEEQWLDYLSHAYPLNVDQAVWEAIQAKL